MNLSPRSLWTISSSSLAVLLQNWEKSLTQWSLSLACRAKTHEGHVPLWNRGLMFLKFLPLGNQHPRASAQVFLPTLSTQPFPSWSGACQLQTLKIEGHCGRTIQTWHLSLHVRDAVLEHWHLSVKFRNHCYIRQTSHRKIKTGKTRAMAHA